MIHSKQLAKLERRNEELQRRNEELERKLHVATDIVKALAAGEVDAVAGELGSTPILLHRAQEKLREQEQILRAIFEGALDAMLLADHEGHLVDANRAACELLGVAKHDLLGREAAQFAAPEYALPEQRRKLFEQGHMRGELPLLRPDGGRRELEFAAVANIIPGLHFCALRDVTERNRYEHVLRETRYFLEQAEAIAQVGGWVSQIGSDAPLIWTTETYRIAGVPEGTPITVAEFFDRVVHCDDRHAVLLAVEDALLRETRFQHEYRIVRPDGEVRWIHTRALFERDDSGVPRRMVGTIQDVTDRRQFEEMRDRLAAIVEFSDDAIISKTLDGTITSWNRGAERLFDYAAEEMIGRSIKLIIPAERQFEETDILAQLERGEAVHHFDTVRQRKDGGLVHVSLSISPIRDESGLVVGASKIARDMTERRTQEAALRRSEEQLRQAQKMEAVGSLAGGIAHDFNNILSVILSYSSLVMDELELDDTVRSDLDEISKAAGRAADLTRQLLAFSRQQMLQPRVLDPNQIVAGIEKMLGRTVGEDVLLSVLPAEEIGKIYADAGQIEQVVMNLIVNARDAMPRGGCLTVETSNVVLDAEYAAERHGVVAGRYVMLAVSDTGVGMDRATMARIFEPFFTTKEEGKGTGLGLSTVYGIVQQSGGHVWVYSEPGEGTTFKVYLPRTDRELEREPSQPCAARSYRGSETVLLVEDEHHLRVVVGSILRKQGYHVLEAQNGGEAFLISEQLGAKIHLLLTDVVMPRMSGRELAERLAPTRPEMSVLYVSGYTKDATVHRGILDASTNFLAKPLTPEALLKKVREVLDAVKQRLPTCGEGLNGAGVSDAGLAATGGHQRRYVKRARPRP